MLTMSKTIAVSSMLVCVAVLAVIVGRSQTSAWSAVPVSTTATSGSTPASSLLQPDIRISGVIPGEVSLPPNPSSKAVENRPFFDSFSWQSFIALNWPAANDGRGVAESPDDPDVFLSAPNGHPTVWGTYKEAFELFGQENHRPSPWDSYHAEVHPDGKSTGRYGDKIFLQANKGSNLLNATNEAFSLPLIDQHWNYAYTDVRFNRMQFDAIRGMDNDETTWLYRMKNLSNAQPVSLPASKSATKAGSIMIKATWRILTEQDDPSRYYAYKSQIFDPESKDYKNQLMGLVGMHIVQKTKTFPEWIWSSFEQVDNVERGPGLPDSIKPSFNNATDTPKTIGGWANRPKKPIPPLQPLANRSPTQVTRFNEIPTTPTGNSTVDINRMYQEKLKGTVWEHYQLVITQWPTNPQSFKLLEDQGLYPEDAGQPFPVNGATNAVMETYFQSPADAAGSGGNSCMSCHYIAGKSDFSWVLQLRAH